MKDSADGGKSGRGRIPSLTGDRAQRVNTICSGGEKNTEKLAGPSANLLPIHECSNGDSLIMIQCSRRNSSPGVRETL